MVWANLHGSFFLAPVLVALAWLQAKAGHDDRAKAGRLVRVGFASMLAANVNPYGLRVWRYAVGIPANRVISDTMYDSRGLVAKTYDSYLVTGDPHRGRALWAYAHGMVMLDLDGRFPQRSPVDAAWRAGADAFQRIRSTGHPQRTRVE